MFNNQIIAGAAGQGGSFYGYSIDQSLRFEEADTPSLSRTQTSGTTTTWTFSAWVKRSRLDSVLQSGGIAGQDPIFTVGDANTNDMLIYFFQHSPADALSITIRDSSTVRAQLRTTRLFRDVASFYHIQVTCDFTNATQGDRLRLYVNGVRETDFDIETYPSDASQVTVVNNSSYKARIGKLRTSESYYAGYMTEIHLVDGIALEPTSFGEFSNGVWIPVNYTGSHGTAGWYLPFADSAAIGRDKAGSKTLVTSTSFSTVGGGTSTFTTNVENAFDGDKSTGVDRVGSGGIIEIAPTTAVTPVSHTMINHNSANYTAASRPNSVKLQGSNDGGSTWTDIDTLTNGSGANTATTSSFSNTTSYAKLRLNIASNHGGTNTRFAEYVVFASEDNDDGENIFFKEGLAASDVVLDSPTNNWATNNGVMRANITQSEGNLKMVGVGNNYDNMASTFTFDVEDSEGWYWEYRSIGNNNDTTIGISKPQNAEFNQSDATNPFSNTTGCVSYNGNGQKKIAGTNSSYGDSWTAGDIIGIAVKSGAVYFYKNGTIQNSGTAAATGLTGQYVAAYAINGTHSGTANYGQDSTFAGTETAASNSDANGLGEFSQTVPSGYKSLCTSNLDEPTIGPNSDEQATDYFDTKLWSSDVVNPAAGDKQISLDFQPDWVWSKNRDNAENHYWMDSVRGDNAGNKWLRSNANAGEGADAISSTTAKYDFTSTGFDIIDTNSASGEVYYNNGSASTPRTYVGWCWKAGGTAVSNTDGSITSNVSAAPDAGFSILSFNSDGTNGTVGHGLNSAPEMVIVKSRTGTAGYSNWGVYHSAMGNTNNMYLNTTNAQTNQGAWNSTSPTNSVVSLGAGVFNATPTQEMIMYCFHSVEGYSKVGSYTGNGSTDGTFVYTGFRPAWVMTKRRDSTGDWIIWDAARNEYNVTNNYLEPNTSDAEVAGSGGSIGIDITSNGWKFRSNATVWNASGGTYIYLAFAEVPFKYANAR